MIPARLFFHTLPEVLMTSTKRTIRTVSPLTGEEYTRTTHRPYTVVAFHQRTEENGEVREAATYHNTQVLAEKAARTWDSYGFTRHGYATLQD
jgi:hypothetical protein